MSRPFAGKITLIASLWSTSLLLGCPQHPEAPLAELRVETTHGRLDDASSASLSLGLTMLRPFPAETSPFLFLHLLSTQGTLVRSFDRELDLAGLTSGQSSQELIEIWQSALAAGLPAGSYHLTGGLYDRVSGKRWQLTTDASEISKSQYQIAAIEVDSAQRVTPELEFEGDWLEPDVGMPHNPGRRWLGTNGSIRLGNTENWHSLAVGVTLNILPASQHRLTVEDGGSELRLVVRSECEQRSDDSSPEDQHEAANDPVITISQPIETAIEGVGVHSVNVPLDGNSECVIELQPNFAMIDLGDFTYRSVGLEWAYFPHDP